MAIKRPRGDQPAPLTAVAQRRMVGGRLSCLARNALAQGKKVDGPPLREGDRGKADPRPDQPIRGRVGARGQTRRRLGDHLAASDKRAAAFAAQSSVPSHQRRQNGGRRTTGFFRIFAAKPNRRPGRKLRMRAAAAFGQRFRAPDAELRVAGHGSNLRGYASIWSRRGSD